MSRCRCRVHRSARDRCAPARSSISPPTDFGVRTCTLRAPERARRSWIGASRRLSSSVANTCPLFCIMAAKANVLPPAPAHRSTTCSPGFAPAEQRGQLRALVLHLDHAFEESRLGMDRRAFGVGRKPHAQGPGRPAARLGLQVGQHAGNLVAVGLQCVDAQIERCARSQRGALLGARVTESAREMRLQPFRIVAGDMRRSTGHVGGIEVACVRRRRAPQAHSSSRRQAS